MTEREYFVGYYSRIKFMNPKTLAEAVALAREVLTNASKESARLLREPPPEIRESNMPDGTVRLVVVWPDGEETNECIVTAPEKSFSA